MIEVRVSGMHGNTYSVRGEVDSHGKPNIELRDYNSMMRIDDLKALSDLHIAIGAVLGTLKDG